MWKCFTTCVVGDINREVNLANGKKAGKLTSFKQVYTSYHLDHGVKLTYSFFLIFFSTPPPPPPKFYFQYNFWLYSTLL